MAKHKAQQSPERQALREAIAAHDDAVEQAERAQTLLDKAHSLHEDLHAQLAEFKDLDASIASARANKLKLALASGDHPLPPDDGQPEFAAKIIARDNLREHLDQITVTLPVLECELKDAQKHVEKCDIAIEHAAAAVFAQEAEKLADKFNSQISELRRIAYLLNVMAMRQIRRAPSERRIAGQAFYGDGPFKRIAMPPAVQQVVNEDIIGTHELRRGFGMRNAAGQSAQAFWQDLQTDANAQLPTAEPEDRREKVEAAE